MSSGTQSPPLENTAPVDPLGSVNAKGEKATGTGALDRDQRQGAVAVCFIRLTRSNILSVAGAFTEGKELGKHGDDAGASISKVCGDLSGFQTVF